MEQTLVKSFDVAESWFVGLYMESFLNDFAKFESEDYRINLAKDLQAEDPYLADSSVDEVLKRVNALYKIIEGKNVLEALNMVILFESDEEPNCYAYEEAKYLTSLIKKGSVKLPY